MTIVLNKNKDKKLIQDQLNQKIKNCITCEHHYEGNEPWDDPCRSRSQHGGFCKWDKAAIEYNKI